MMIKRFTLFLKSFSTDAPTRALLRAIAFNRLPELTAHSAHNGYVSGIKTNFILSQHLDLIPVAHIDAIKNHQLMHALLRAGLIARALEAETPTLLRILANSDVFLDSSFETQMYYASQTETAHHEIASLALAALADSRIAKEQWHDYAEGILTAVRWGGPKWAAWAHRADLPLLDCLPIREAIAGAYKTLPEERTFKLMHAIGQAQSGHSQMALKLLLERCGPTPAACLAAPQDRYFEGIDALKGLS